MDNYEQELDKFLALSPKSFAELSTMLADNLTWTGYEECEISPDILETLVKAFLTTKGIKID